MRRIPVVVVALVAVLGAALAHAPSAAAVATSTVQSITFNRTIAPMPTCSQGKSPVLATVVVKASKRIVAASFHVTHELWDALGDVDMEFRAQSVTVQGSAGTYTITASVNFVNTSYGSDPMGNWSIHDMDLSYVDSTTDMHVSPPAANPRVYFGLDQLASGIPRSIKAVNGKFTISATRQTISGTSCSPVTPGIMFYDNDGHPQRYEASVFAPKSASVWVQKVGSTTWLQIAQVTTTATSGIRFVFSSTKVRKIQVRLAAWPGLVDGGAAAYPAVIYDIAVATQTSERVPPPLR